MLLEIPALLPLETIEAIHRKAKLNKKFDRKYIKNKYLLARIIYCSECGLGMSGQANSKKRLYYRHSRYGDGKCSNKTWSVPAGIIEDAVFFHIYSLMGDKEKLAKAIKKAVPDRSIRKQMEQEITTLKNNLKSIKTKKSNLLNAVADGVFVVDDVKSKMDDLREQEKMVGEQIAANHKIIKSIPSEEELKNRTKFGQRVLKFAKSRYLKSVEHLCEMPWEDKRKLLELVFSVVRRDGVFVNKVDKSWHYEIKGSFGVNLSGALPLKRNEIIELLRLDADFADDQLDLLSKCYAHNGLGIYQ